MNNNHYIGADVHSNNIEIAVRYRGEIAQRFSLPTTLSAIRPVLDSIKGPKQMAIEEGPMSGWLYRSLNADVDKFIVAEPRRNKLISSDGDHDDPIDAAKLAMLLEGGFLKPVYHSSQQDRAILKKWVNLYHDTIKNAVRSINKIRACCRMEGVKIQAVAIKNPEKRSSWLGQIKTPGLADQLIMLFVGYDAVAKQCRMAKQKLITLSKAYPVVKQFEQLPGVGVIRSITFFAYIDTPWRFKKKNKLWKYCGIGLERVTSGKDKKGRPRPAKLQLPWICNRVLKNAMLGAALSAIRQKNNPFACDYERMVSHGMIQSNARHTVARKLLTAMWGLWKSSYQQTLN
jgi:transposase